MRVYDQRDDDGRLISFEIENTSRLQTRGMCQLVSRVPGVRLLETSGERLDGEFCRVELGGGRFVVIEPFGDNSRIAIGPLDGAYHPGLQPLRDAFSSDHPALWFQSTVVLSAVALVSGLALGLVMPTLVGGTGLVLIGGGAAGLLGAFVLGVAGCAGSSKVWLLAWLRGLFR